MTDVAKLIQVIETTLTRRGNGTEGNPTRIITQYWSVDGELLAEVDPVRKPYETLANVDFEFVAPRRGRA